MQGEASTRLGFTDYFRVELAWAKLLGAVLLLAPVPARLKEWAYAAFAITLGSALIAHLSIGEGPRRRGAGRRAPGVLWGLSYFCGVASRARASAGPLEDEQRVANQDPKNPAQMKASTGSPLTDVSAASRFHVDDGRSVQSFEMSHLQSSTVDCRNDHVMQTDRIRTVGGSRAQYVLLLSGAVTSRMHCEHVPTSAIEPGDKNQFIARSACSCSPSRTSGSNTSHAAGAPSSGCLGADSARRARGKNGAARSAWPSKPSFCSSFRCRRFRGDVSQRVSLSSDCL